MEGSLSINPENVDSLIITLAIILLGISLIWFLILRIRQEIKHVKGSVKGSGVFRKALLPVTFLFLMIAARLNVDLILTDPELHNFSKDLLRILIIFGGTWISINTVRIIRFFILKRLDVSNKDNLKARKIITQFKVLSRIIVFTIIFLAISVALMTFESIRSMGVSLFASAGVAGIILGLAAQKVIGSVIAGFQIAITQPIRIDDVVIVEGEWGWIEEILLTYVVVRIWDKRRLVLPTTYFFEKPFQNWTRNTAEILGTVYIYSDYTLPVGKLREAYLEMIKKAELWDGNVANIQVTNATEKTMEIRALMSAPDSSTAWDLRVYMREKLIEYLQENYPDQLPRTRISLENEK
ncbi:MAG: mechanosensitive ion channel family protein [Bacteroidales bacterium]